MSHATCQHMTESVSQTVKFGRADQPGGFERIQHADLAELTYTAIRKRILMRELRTGEQIPVEAVALMLGVSRTPVIDALRRLETEGLVEIRARRGCFVR